MKKITLNKIKKEIRNAHYQAMKWEGLEYSVIIDLDKNEIWTNADTLNTRYQCKNYLYVFSDYNVFKPDDINNCQHCFIEYKLDELAEEAYNYYLKNKESEER